MEIYPAYKCKTQNAKCKMQKKKKKIILLMKPNKENEGWHYLALKKLSAILHGMTMPSQKDNF